MSLDVQILNSALSKLVQSTVQQMLDTSCSQPFGDSYVDHADVISVTVTVDPNAGVALVDAPVNVFIVNMASLLASVNGTPPGALSPFGQGNVMLRLSVTGTVLSLACDTVVLPDLSSFGVPTALLNVVEGQIKTAIGTKTFDLAPAFSQLGLPNPTSSLIEGTTKNSLVIRFDPPAGAPIDHLQGGQDWCLFLDADTMKTIVLNKLSKPLSTISASLTGVATSVVWAPSGSAPHVDVKVTGNYPIPDPFPAAKVELDLSIDFKLQSAPKALEEIVDWNLSVDFPPFGDFIATIIASSINPALFGGTVIGPRAFSLSQILPVLRLGSATFSYASVTGLSDGMILGGPITGIPVASTNITTYIVDGFASQLVVVTDCLSGGKVSSPVTLASVSAVTSSAIFVDAGKLCSVDILSPPTSSIDLNAYLATSPAAGSVTNAVNINLGLPGLASVAVFQIGLPVRILVNTARGVRVVDFGLPPDPKLDSSGNPTNYKIIEIWDCPGNLARWSQVFPFFNPKWGVDPPESWVDNMEEVATFGSSLIEINGLQPGELITFNQPVDGGLAVFSANQSGRVTVPAVLPVRSFDASAILSRVNREPLGGTGQTTLLFERIATLNTPGALSHQLLVDGDTAVITSSFIGRTESTQIDSLGIVRNLRQQQPAGGASVGRQSGTAAGTGKQVDPQFAIPGVLRIRSVPGFEQGRISIAELDDGALLVLAQEKDGSVRVGGTLPRWPDMPPISGRWAISSSKGDRVAVFTVRQVTPPVQCCCGCE